MVKLASLLSAGRDSRLACCRCAPESDLAKIADYQTSAALQSWFASLVGECALQAIEVLEQDCSHLTSASMWLDRAKTIGLQVPAFKAQLHLAAEFDLPIVHSVRSHSDVLALETAC